MLTILPMVIICQYIQIPNHYTVLLRLMQHYVSVILQLKNRKKLKKEYRNDYHWSYVFADIHEKFLRLNSEGMALDFGHTTLQQDYPKLYFGQ